MDFRLTPKAMTLDDLEHQNEGFLWIFGDFGLRNIIQERIALKSMEISKNEPRVTFSALNVDFDNPSLDFLVSRKPAHEGIKQSQKSKVVILPLLTSLSRKRLQIGMGMLPITTSTSDELFSRINIDDFERP